VHKFGNGNDFEWEGEGLGILKTIPRISICVSFHSLPNLSGLFSPCQLFDIMPNAGNSNLIKFRCFCLNFFDRVCVAILHRTLCVTFAVFGHHKVVTLLEIYLGTVSKKISCK